MKPDVSAIGREGIVTSIDVVRRLAFALPQTIEQDHHGRPSFRVGGRIFATIWEADRLNVMLDGEDILARVGEHPGVCEAFHWGRRLRALQVYLSLAGPDLVAALLEEAWARKAPHRLLAGGGGDTV